MRYATLLLLALAACHGGPNTPVYTPLLPADFAATYKEVRPCRNSTDHDTLNNNVTVLADPTAYGPYTTRTAPFPVGAPVVVKQEHLMEDENCTEGIVQWTIMVKLADGSSPSTDDWTWQNIAFDRTRGANAERPALHQLPHRLRRPAVRVSRHLLRADSVNQPQMILARRFGERPTEPGSTSI